MFKRGIFVLVLCGLMAGSAFAQSTVGVANMQIVASQCEPAKVAQKLLDSKLGKERTALEKQAQTLQKSSTDFQAQAATMNQAARQTKQQELVVAGRNFEEKRRIFAVKVQTEENAMRQSLAEVILKASAQLAKKKKFDLLFDSAMGSVLFAKESLDATDDLLKEVNAVWKAQGSKF